MSQRNGLFAVVACIFGLSSCSAIQEDQARYTQQKQQKCQEFGLTRIASDCASITACISSG